MDVGCRRSFHQENGTDLKQLSLADFAKLPLPSWAISHAACLVLLLTGPIRMVCVEVKRVAHVLIMAGFIQRTQVANWLNVAAMVATTFLLLSFLILPVKWTHRHYLSICVAFAVAVMEVHLIQKVIAARADYKSLHSSFL